MAAAAYINCIQLSLKESNNSIDVSLATGTVSQSVFFSIVGVLCAAIPSTVTHVYPFLCSVQAQKKQSSNSTDHSEAAPNQTLEKFTITYKTPPLITSFKFFLIGPPCKTRESP